MFADVTTPRKASRRLEGLSLVAVFVLLSFLPSSLKLMLHTRGPLHLWAHLYLFAGMTTLLLDGAPSRRQRIISVVVIAVLACAVEFLQANLLWPAVEVRDVAGNLFGWACGLFLWWLRAEAGWTTATLASPLPNLDPGW